MDADLTLRFVRPHWSYFRLSIFHIGTSPLHRNDIVTISFVTTVQQDIDITDVAGTLELCVPMQLGTGEKLYIQHCRTAGVNLWTPVITNELMRFTSSGKLLIRNYFFLWKTSEERVGTNEHKIKALENLCYEKCLRDICHYTFGKINCLKKDN